MWVKNKIEYQDTINLCIGGALLEEGKETGVHILVSLFGSSSFGMWPAPLLLVWWGGPRSLRSCSGPSYDRSAGLWPAYILCPNVSTPALCVYSSWIIPLFQGIKFWKRSDFPTGAFGFTSSEVCLCGVMMDSSRLCWKGCIFIGTLKHVFKGSCSYCKGEFLVKMNKDRLQRNRINVLCFEYFQNQPKCPSAGGWINKM